MHEQHSVISGCLREPFPNVAFGLLILSTRMLLFAKYLALACFSSWQRREIGSHAAPAFPSPCIPTFSPRHARKAQPSRRAIPETSRQVIDFLLHAAQQMNPRLRTSCSHPLNRATLRLGTYPASFHSMSAGLARGSWVWILFSWSEFLL